MGKDIFRIKKGETIDVPPYNFSYIKFMYNNFRAEKQVKVGNEENISIRLFFYIKT